LWKEHNVPFLVIEPAKNEYRALVQSIEEAVSAGNNDEVIAKVGSAISIIEERNRKIRMAN